MAVLSPRLGIVCISLILFLEKHIDIHHCDSDVCGVGPGRVRVRGVTAASGV